MQAYTGEEAFVFLSYSHVDRELLQKILVGLKKQLCRVWYDEGLTPGESWNDELAERIKTADAVVVVLTENSCNSQFVRSEMNYAISKQKKIIPVCMAGLEMPAGIEMMLTPYQFINIETINDVENKIENIIKALPRNVFANKKEPFLKEDRYMFFLEKHTVENHNSNNDVTADGFTIICECENERKELFSFTGTFAYDIQYTITQCNAIKDDFFVGSISGLYIFNVLANCWISYPLYGPDFDCLMVFALRIPDEGRPSVSLIDYKYVHINQLTLLEGETVENSSWSCFLNQKIEEKLKGYSK